MAKEKKEIADLIMIEGVDCKGFGVIPKIVTTDTNLSIGAKALYAYLCSYAGNGTTAFPRRDKILSNLKMCKDAYYKYQKELITQGYIRAERSNIYPFPNTYTIVSRPPKLNSISESNSKNLEGDIIISRGIKSMGYGTVPKAVMLDSRLHYKAKALYAYFCSFAGNGTTAIPTRDTICYHLHIAINSFQKYLRQLIEFNYIEVTQSIDNGRFSHNIYAINDLPNGEKGKREIERRKVVQEQKHTAKKEGQAELKSKGVNIDTFEDIAIKTVVKGANSTNNKKKITEKQVAVNVMNQRNIYREILEENLEYDVMQSYQDETKKQLADFIFNIILDTVTSQAETIKVGKENFPTEVVKSRFLKLTFEDVEYVISNLINSTTKIVNIPAYIMTCLYNAKTQDFNMYNQVKSDFGY